MVTKAAHHLVIGHKGEVGGAMYKVLSEAGLDVHGVDLNVRTVFELRLTYDVIHVCIGWSAKFLEVVNQYKLAFLPDTGKGLLIVHSTVPIGTCRKIGAIHSPIRGVHPNLDQGIKTFVKLFGGDRADEAAAIFSEIGIQTKTTPLSETSEHAKLWDTTQYGLMITLEKAIHDDCAKQGTDYDIVYGWGNETYNDGYARLGRVDVIRPNLKHMSGKIGGHCIIPNAALLDDPVAKFIIEQNEKRE